MSSRVCFGRSDRFGDWSKPNLSLRPRSGGPSSRCLAGACAQSPVALRRLSLGNDAHKHTSLHSAGTIDLGSSSRSRARPKKGLGSVDLPCGTLGTMRRVALVFGVQRCLDRYGTRVLRGGEWGPGEDKHLSAPGTPARGDARPTRQSSVNLAVRPEALWGRKLTRKLGIVSKLVQKLVGKLTLFQSISQVLSHRKTT
jgi:hypothetical protein